MASIRLIGKQFNIEVPLGLAFPSKTAGGARIGETERPGRDSVSVYEGDSLIKLDVPILFDSWTGGRADQLPRVMQMEGLARGSKGNPPPTFLMKGPIPYSGMRFWMEPPEWSADPEPIVTQGGKVYRQAMVLHLVEFNPAQAVRWHQVRIEPDHGSFPTRVKLEEPESLLKVAIRLYEDPTLAPQLAKLNDIHDVRKKLAKGTVVRLLGDNADSGKPGGRSGQVAV